MQKVLRKSAKTEDEALRLALEELGLDRDDVSVEIIERAKSGFLGIGASPAVIAVTYEAPDEAPDEPAPEVKTEAPPPEPPKMQKNTAPAGAESAKSAPRPEPRDAHPEEPPVRRPVKDESKGGKRAKEQPRQEQPPPAAATETSAESKEEQTRVYLRGLLERLGVNAEINVADETDGVIAVTIASGEAGALIGRRGETLDAIQSLTNYTVNKSSRQRLRIIIDAEDYRKRRSETLEALAARTASKVAKYRRNITLEPMNAYERHLIHAALQEHEYVSTHSVGSEPNRRVVVAYGKSAGAPVGRAGPAKPGADRREPRKKEPRRGAETEAGQNDGYPGKSQDYKEWK